MKNLKQELDQQISEAIYNESQRIAKKNKEVAIKKKIELANKFVEYLFPSDYVNETFKMQLTINNSPMQLTQRKQQLKKNLDDLKHSKNKDISKGHLGQSLYIKIKEKKIIIQF